MSREALSLDISQVVALVVGGEAVDTAERGQWLASKYPDLGMSAEMIGQAIDRAAGMMGMIKNAPEPVVPRRADPALTRPNEGDDAIRMPANGHLSPDVAPVLPPMPRATLLIDDDLAAAIDAEISGLVIASRKTAQPAAETAPAARNGSYPPFVPRNASSAASSSYQPRERAFPARPTQSAEPAAPPRVAGASFEPRGAVFEPGYPAGRGEASHAEAERSAFSRVRRAFFRH